MALFDMFKKKAAAAPPQEVINTSGKLTKEDFTVVGLQYHEDSIKKLGVANEDWRKSAKTIIAEEKVMQKIYHYTYINKPVKIVSDTGEIYRKGALMVFIAGEHVGYISDEDESHVKAILSQTSVKYITASIRGGEYKVVSLNGDAVKEEDRIRISVRIAYA